MPNEKAIRAAMPMPEPVAWAEDYTLRKLKAGVPTCGTIFPKSVDYFTNALYSAEAIAVRDARIAELDFECEASMTTIADERERASALQAENERLREALKPFVAYAKEYRDDESDATKMPVRIGDLRRAKQAYEGK